MPSRLGTHVEVLLPGKRAVAEATRNRAGATGPSKRATRSAMPQTQRSYVPAAGHDWLLPFYDPITKVMGGESLHRQLIDQAQLQPGQRVLEIGCGTGSLTTLVKRLCPAVDVVGLDPDPKALDRARRKAERYRVSIALDRGFSDALHYPDASYDRVLSALMFHHLDRDEKMQSLSEVRRVLKPNGSLHLLDFGGTGDRSDGFLAHLLHRSEHLRDSTGEAVLSLMRAAGFADATEVAQQRTIFGRIACYRAVKPPAVGTGT
ncbi:MAG: class I SAM-dependent methyltransferase [Candidatus Binatia bacterium]